MRDQQKPSSFLILRDMLIGTFAGTSAALISFLGQSVKKSKQMNEAVSFKLNRKNFARITTGFPTFWLALTFTTTIQYTSKEALAREMGQSPQLDLTIGAASGAMGGVFSTIVENVMCEQKKHGTKMIPTVKNLLSESPARILVGGGSIMTREAIFFLTIVYGVDAARKYLKEHHQIDSGLLATFTVGMLGSAASHPFDTVATEQQNKPENRQFTKAVTSLWRENGPKAFSKGLGARSFLFIAAVGTLHEAFEFATAHLKDKEESRSFSKS